MPNIKSSLIAALVLSNSVTGVVLWRSLQQTQYQTQKAQAFASAFEYTSKENYRLTKVISPQPPRAKTRVLPQ